ncbi:sensor histidine kinase [Fodinicola acaciae]|uniref:sensor histidine kinase n=1 Tax=Fodinicola acaciae TaxID=2681555 RepID=UPI0013D54F2D|nr:HAMP domain-containing sensor histidine kinase [Fodinicola acaciae]
MRLTARVRLAATFGALFVIGGLVLTTAIYLLVQADLVAQLQKTITVAALPACTETPAGTVHDGCVTVVPGTRFEPAMPARTVPRAAAASGATVLDKLLATSGVSLLLMTILVLLIVWWLSGRMLRPVHEISALARRLSSESLHERIHLNGPKDELSELADTFDDMLERLEKAFESQRRFIANASHELRTPVSIQRTAIQIGLADPTASSLAKTRANLLDANRRIERLLDSLLVLARSDRGLDHREDVDLAATARNQLGQHRAAIASHDLEIRARLDDCTVDGDPALLTQLVDNLVGNAIRHNTNGGYVDVRTSAGKLVVTNSGPVVTGELLDRIFQPFQRGEGRVAAGGSTGLGLSIVESIADAHKAAVQARPGPDGGLEVTVTF